MKYLVCLIALLLISGFAYADKTLFYKTYKEETNEVTNETSFHMGVPVDGKIVVKWNNKTTGDMAEQIMGSDYATQSWKSSNPEVDTDYTGERKGKNLLIKGKLKGKKIDTKAKINDNPFFFFPALGLSEFVKSGKESQKFWMLLPDNKSDEMKVHEMKAENQGPENIVLRGKKVETIKVKWGLTGFRARFFSQTFWFRKSDGVFVKSSPFRGAFMELVDEQ
jgi:hypothetical protein